MSDKLPGPHRRIVIALRAAAPFKDYLMRQRLLQRSAYKRDPAQLHGEDRANFIMWNVLAAQVELGEMLQEVRWKPWQVDRSTIGEFKDRDKFVEEGVDVLHFIANLLIAAGCDDAELSRRFIAKQETNRKRQETNYAGDGAAWDRDHR